MWQALFVVAVAALVFGFMIVEAIRAAHNERTQRARGGILVRHHEKHTEL